MAHREEKERRIGGIYMLIRSSEQPFIRFSFLFFGTDPVFVRLPIFPTQAVIRVAAKKDKTEPRSDETGLLIPSLQ
jgi:hypothetical protein